MVWSINVLATEKILCQRWYNLNFCFEVIIEALRETVKFAPEFGFCDHVSLSALLKPFVVIFKLERPRRPSLGLSTGIPLSKVSC